MTIMGHEASVFYLQFAVSLLLILCKNCGKRLLSNRQLDSLVMLLAYKAMHYKLHLVLGLLNTDSGLASEL